MKLTIAILFCDKDYQHIPFLLDLIEDNVLIKYELILVDNREASKYEYIDFKNATVIDMQYNARQLQGRKQAINYATGDYIWFIDADDEVLFISEDKQNLLNKDYDAIYFNFYNEKIPCKLFEEDKIINKPCERDVYINGRNMLWNKWIKTDILKKVETHIPTDIVASASEDTALVLGTLKYSKTLYECSDFVYIYKSTLGSIGQKHISAPNRFQEFLIGHGQVTSLILNMLTENELTSLNLKDIWIEDMCFFLRKLLHDTDEDIFEEVCTLIVKEFPRDILISSWTETASFLRMKKEKFYKIRDIFERELGTSLRIYKTATARYSDKKGNEWTEDYVYEVLPAFSTEQEV